MDIGCIVAIDMSRLSSQSGRRVALSDRGGIGGCTVGGGVRVNFCPIISINASSFVKQSSPSGIDTGTMSALFEALGPEFIEAN